MFITVFIIGILLDYLIARAAKEKGRSFGCFFALGFFLSPLVSAIVLLVFGKKETSQSYDTSVPDLHLPDEDSMVNQKPPRKEGESDAEYYCRRESDKYNY